MHMNSPPLCDRTPKHKKTAAGNSLLTCDSPYQFVKMFAATYSSLYFTIAIAVRPNLLSIMF